MSHDITNDLEAIYSNRPAWHRLGQTFKPGESVGMLTADVERLCPTIFAERHLLPIFGNLAGGTDLGSEVLFGSDFLSGGDFRMIARTDGANAKVHGVAKKGYNIWQVREAFAFLDGLCSTSRLSP